MIFLEVACGFYLDGGDHRDNHNDREFDDWIREKVYLGVV